MRKNKVYLKLLEMYAHMKEESASSNVIVQSVDDTRYKRTSTDNKSHRYSGAFVINDISLFGMCTHKEWYLVGRIGSELKRYNALWYCDPTIKNNSSSRVAVKGLIEKGILISSDTTNIYMVNPLWIRRGEAFAVVCTTANMLKDEGAVGMEHITNKRPVKSFIFDVIIKPIANEIEEEEENITLLDEDIPCEFDDE